VSTVRVAGRSIFHFSYYWTVGHGNPVIRDSQEKSQRNTNCRLLGETPLHFILKLVVDWRDGMVDPVFGEIKRPVVVTIEIEMD
jgi:hypothetical protein